MAGGEIDWRDVKRVLIVKLRSIGDTVLSTPSLYALKRAVPHVKVDILLEDWVAPLLEGFEYADEVIAVRKSAKSRFNTAIELGRAGYDVAFNLHGGTTATFFTAASMAAHRVGLASYQYSFLYNHLLSSAADFWGRENTHSAEQQLALIGYAGIPVDDKPKSRLTVMARAAGKVDEIAGDGGEFALIHPASVFVTKQWPVENFARTAEFLAGKGLRSLAVAAANEKKVLDELVKESAVPIRTFDDLTLPEITALAARARVFVGNDSGIAHIAAAVGTPAAVVFGSSNRVHWSPWTDAPHEIIFNEFHCQPCAGYRCEEFGEPRCILSVEPSAVAAAIDRILKISVR